jgi:hypothetical protein
MVLQGCGLKVHPALPIAGASAAIGGWFLYFAHGGIQAGLSGDDLMNLYV